MGLIGFGLGGAAFHGPVIAATPGLVIAAIVTSNASRREQAVRLYPAARVFANAAEMFPLLEGRDAAGHFFVKARGTPDQAAQSIRAIVHAAYPALPITYLRTVGEQVNRSLNTERILATLSGAFGSLALLLSLVGLYGVMSFVITERTREIGIRMALGSRGSAAVWLVLRDALAMIVAGTAVALPSVGLLGRLVDSQVFGVTATDPVTIPVTTVLLAAAALGAALIPACRASTVNPTDALRAQ